jgi:hypothetical protein
MADSRKSIRHKSQLISHHHSGTVTSAIAVLINTKPAASFTPSPAASAINNTEIAVGAAACNTKASAKLIGILHIQFKFLFFRVGPIFKVYLAMVSLRYVKMMDGNEVETGRESYGLFR